jgi:hypothetical protein
MAEQKGGRPRHGDDIKRVPLSFRTTPVLRDALDAAAATSGRSLAQEVELRLEQSFREDEPDQAEAIRIIRDIMDHVSVRVGASWMDDLTAWEIVFDGIGDLLVAVRPETRGLAAPPALERTDRIVEALEQYERKRGELEPKRQKLGQPQLRAAMKAAAGTITEQDSAAARAAWEEWKNLPSRPKPDLTPEELDAWEAEQSYERSLKAARQLAHALSEPLRRRKKDG